MASRIKYLLLFIFSVTWLLKTNGQKNNLSFQLLKPAEGSIFNITSCFTQDRLGYLWIGTQNGLVQYDGHTATTFLKNNSGNSLSDNLIYSLYADKKNSVYIGTVSGLCKYDIVTKKFFTYKSRELRIQDIKEDESGNLWIAATRGLFFGKLNTDTLVPYTVLEKGQPVITGSIQQLAWCKPWMYAATANSGVIKINTLTSGQKIIGQSGKLASNNVLGLCCDSKNNVWVVSDNTRAVLQKIEAGENITESYMHFQNDNSFLLSNNFTYLLSDNEDKLWLNSISNGVTEFNPRSKEFTDYMSGGLQTGANLTHYLSHSFQDRSGIIWLGTIGFGAEYFQPVPDLFTNLSYNNQNANTLADSWGRCAVQQDEDHVWLATAGGISIYDLKTGIFRNISNTPKKNYFFSNSVRSLCRDSKGNIWIGTAEGLNRYNAATKEIEYFKSDKGIPQSFIWSIIETASGTIMASCPQGVFVFINDHFEDFFKINRLEKYRKNVVYQMEDSKHNLWFLTYGKGILLYDPLKNSITELNNKLTPGLLPENRNNSINEDPTGNIWIGGYGGLVKYNPLTKQSKKYDTAFGVTGGWVSSILFDQRNRLWATTNDGLMIFNPATDFFKRFTFSDGLPQGGFNGQRDIVLKDGRFLLASLSGFTLFNPNEYLETEEDFPFYIASFKAGINELQQYQSMEETSSIRLKPDQNFFSIHLSAPVFDANENIFFSYKLEGVDKDWITTKQRDINYTNVPGGDYTFRYKAGSNPLIWLRNEKKLAIHIGTPYYKTWWFKILSVFILIALVFIYYRSRLLSQRKLQEEKLKVEKLNAGQYKSRLEMEQVINYFTSSLVDKHKIDDVLWDVAKNLIGKLGFVDCIIYLWNDDKTKMVQKAGYGPKGSLEEIIKLPFDVEEGQGVVGYVMKHKVPVIIPDTSVDERYRPDELVRASEITVPIVYNDELIGIIDSEHHEKDFFTEKHLQLLLTIAALMETKIHDIQAQYSLQMAQKEKAEMQYENLKQHLNPHFLFNSLAAVIGLIKNDPKLAVEFVKNLNRVYRYILQNKDEQLVTLQAELDFAQQYFQLQKIRFGKGIEIQINIDEMAFRNKVVPVTLQNLIENAIKHNVIDDENPLLIEIFTEADYLVVRNNLQKKSFVETSNQLGLKNMKMLYNYLSDEPFLVDTSTQYFTVKIPLL